MKHPHIAEINGHKTLIVHDEPFIMLAGEVHNSNSSCLEYMKSVWEQAEMLGMNSLLMPISWELTEPEEGIFDYSLVDGLIAQAREHGMKIGFLWFGAWKNAQCYYAPEWVKRDTNRFKRAQMEKGKNFIRRTDFHGMPYTTLSYLCEETRIADAKAFAALMTHIREVDSEENTVIMVQVENETGVMAAAREHSDEADASFTSPAPQDFVDYMRSHTATMVPEVKAAVEAGADYGTWEEVFGDWAEEIFSAYYVASYVNSVAQAGKREYDLPMAANCWLDKGEAAGQFPSGGPVSRVMEVWQYCAPAIDIIAPDIYVPNFVEICNEYTRRGTPLFIPECATHSYAASRLMYTVGHYHAMCYSPFGFEDMGKPFTASQAFLFGVDVNDPALKTPQDIAEYEIISKHLRGMLPMLTERYGTHDLQAITGESPEENKMIFGTFGFHVIVDSRMLPGKNGGCLAWKESEDTFYLLITKAGMVWFSCDPSRPNVDVLALEEGHFENGEWKRGRRLNGDEAVITVYKEPTLLRVKLLAYD